MTLPRLEVPRHRSYQAGSYQAGGRSAASATLAYTIERTFASCLTAVAFVRTISASRS
jgi:hypothetical protein